MQARHTGVAAAIAITVGMTNAAGAATMTFDGIDDDDFNYEEYSEDGITVTGDPLIEGSRAETAHLDDDGSYGGFTLTFTMAEPFDAVSFDLFPYGGYEICEPLEGGQYYETVCEPYSYENVEVTGYAEGVVVASDTFDMFVEAGTYTFDATFTGLDSLVLGFAPGLDTSTQPTESPFFYCSSYPCTHYDVDNVTLTPSVVPLPATGALLGLALPALLLLRRRRA